MLLLLFSTCTTDMSNDDFSSAWHGRTDCSDDQNKFSALPDDRTYGSVCLSVSQVDSGLGSLSEDFGYNCHVKSSLSSVADQPETEVENCAAVGQLENSINNISIADESYESTDTQSNLRLFVADEDGDTSLHTSIIQAVPLNVIHWIVSRAPQREVIDLQNHLWQTPLHLAVITNQPQTARYLFNAGATLETRDRHGDTALHLACKLGYIECLQCLTSLPTGFTMNLTQQDVDKFNLQIQHVVDLANYEGVGCLHLAAFHRRSDIVHHLLQACGSDINIQELKSGRTILHHAVESNDVAMVTYLLGQSGIDLDLPTYDNSTALDLATGRQLTSMVDLLVQNSAHRSKFRYSIDVDEEPSDMDDLVIGGNPLQCT